MDEQEFREELGDMFLSASAEAEAYSKCLWDIYESIRDAAFEHNIERLPLIREEDDGFVVTVCRDRDNKFRLIIQYGPAGMEFYVIQDGMKRLQEALITHPKEAAAVIESRDKIRDMVVSGFKKAFNGE